MPETAAKLRPILVVDDDPYMRSSLTDCLVSCGYAVETAIDGVDALGKFRKGAYEMVITDIRMPKMGGLDLLRELKGQSPDTPVIVITAYGTVNTAVEAMKQGAKDFIMKPFSLDDLEMVVKNVLERGPEQEAVQDGGPGSTETARPAQRQIVTSDAKMAELLEFLKNIARSRSSVLIRGESGTGKELLARFIHHYSPRRSLLSPSTARRSPTRCWRARCSASRRALSQVPRNAESGSSSWPTGGRCCSTRSARWTCRSRRSSSGSSRNPRSTA
jgi:DNA-binding NtrC family response regulator